MKKLISVLALSLGVLSATSTMAGSQYSHYDEHRYHSQDRHHWDNNQWNDRYQQQKRVNPSRDWRAGQKFPRAFDNNRYEISHRDSNRLNRPGRYQQWYKINGDYVLVNERSNRIIRIVG